MRLGLVLGAGGARGFVHIGVLRALEKLKVRIDCIAGSSMGAIIGALYALHRNSHEVERILGFYLEKYSKEVNVLKNYAGKNTLEDKEIFLEKSFNFVKEVYLWNLRIIKPYLMNPRPFFRLFKDIFKLYRFRDCKIPFTACSVDLITGREVFMRDGFLSRAITASSSLPGIFPPLKIRGQLLVDGGILCPFPARALKERADFIVGVNLDESWQQPAQMHNAIDILFATDKIRYNRIVSESLKEADMVFSPSAHSYNWADFHKRKELIRLGEEAVLNEKKAFIGELRRARIKTFFIFPPRLSPPKSR